MTIHVQRARVRDLGKVKPLWRHLLRAVEEGSHGIWQVTDPDEAWQARMQEYLDWINDATGVVFLATDARGDDEEAVIGYAALRLHEEGLVFVHGQTVGEVEAIVVAPDRRGEGVGSALLDACRSELTKREIRFWTVQTMAANEEAQHLCAKHGFAPFSHRLAQLLTED